MLYAYVYMLYVYVYMLYGYVYMLNDYNVHVYIYKQEQQNIF